MFIIWFTLYFADFFFTFCSIFIFTVHTVSLLFIKNDNNEFPVLSNQFPSSRQYIALLNESV